MSRPLCETTRFSYPGFSMDGSKPVVIRPLVGINPKGMSGLSLQSTCEVSTKRGYGLEVPLSVDGGYNLDLWVDNSGEIHHAHLTIRATADNATNSIIRSFINSQDEQYLQREIEANFAANVPKLVVTPEHLKFFKGEWVIFKVQNRRIGINSGLIGNEWPDDTKGGWQEGNSAPYRLDCAGPDFTFEYQEMKVPYKNDQGEEINIVLISGLKVATWDLAKLNAKLAALFESGNITEQAIRGIANPYMRLKI